MARVVDTARLEVRLPAEIYAMLKRAAEIQGRTLTDFVVDAARDAALKTLEDADIIRLSVGDQHQLAAAILKPLKPAASLQSAFRRRRDLFGSE